MLGMARDKLRHALGEGPAAVHLQVPGRRADAGEEILPRRLLGDELAVEMARVPADQDIADVEDGDGCGHGDLRRLIGGRRLYSFHPLAPREGERVRVRGLCDHER